MDGRSEGWMDAVRNGWTQGGMLGCRKRGEGICK